MDFVNLTNTDLKFNNMASGPAPVGRILNYIILAGQGKLKYKAGKRQTRLENDYGDAWCIDLIYGLGLFTPDEGSEYVKLSKEGNELYMLIKDHEPNFNEKTNSNALKQCKDELYNYSKDAYELFYADFKKSIVFKNLCTQLSKYLKIDIGDFDEFKQKYFGDLKKFYTNESYEPASNTANTDDNRLASIFQLCEFFDIFDKNNITFDILKVFKNDSNDNRKDMNNESNKGNGKSIMLKERNKNSKIDFLGFNTILYGAPGTSKTYSMPEYAVRIIDNLSMDEFVKKYKDKHNELLKRYNELIIEGRIVFTTFHQNYTYEDFIQGLKPDVTLPGLNFKMVDGVFKKIADNAMNDETDGRYVIIIDEINRANISKVFGELITLIEEDKRWGEDCQMMVTLPSGDYFAVPNNLYILGTMNSADKSISLLDTALRRRFDFIENKPDGSLIADATLNSLFTKLNTKLNKELESTDLLIGHAFFIGKTTNDLIGIMNNKIIPLLYEYFYDNRKKVEAIVKEVLIDIPEFKIDADNQFGRITITK